MKKTNNKMKITGLLLSVIMIVTAFGAFSLSASAAEPVVAWKDTDNDGIQDSGEAKYTSLSTALSAGGTVKLTNDYTLGDNDTDEQYISMSSGTATLDLNGHTLICASLIKEEIIVLSGSADLTITDSKTTGVFRCDSRIKVILSDSSKLTFAGGIIKTNTVYTEYYLTINKSENAVFEITGGKHYSNPTEYVAANHKVTIGEPSNTEPRYTVSKIETNEVVAWNDADNDGVIDSSEQVFSDMDTALAAGVDLKMNSDIVRDSIRYPPGSLKITSTKTIDLNGYSIVASAYCFEVTGGTLTIKDSAGGGQLLCQNDEKYAAIAVYSGSNIGLTVESGTILGSIAHYGAHDYPDAVVLNGGNYSFDPSEYIKDSNFTAGQDSSGLWGIRPKAENACSVTISGPYKYTGEAITPTIAVTDLNSKTLTEDTDYTVSFSNNINAGTATATVTFINDYRGSISKNFTITCDHTLSEHTTAEDNIGYGKHRFVCSVCNDSSTETHKFNESNECICGAKAVASVITTSTPPVETKYATIDEAIVAARSMSGSTVKLLDNIQLSSDLNISLGKFIIDLNGKTISEASGFSDINLIVLQGTDTEITIDDSSAEKNGKITFGADNYTITVFSKLIVKNGTIENTATDGKAIVTGFADKGTKIYGNVVIENGRFLGEVEVNYTTFDISGGEFDSLKIINNEAAVVGGMLKGGSFGTITVNGTSFADCIAEHSYYYNASDEMLIPAAETTALTDVTVKQGTDLSKYAVITVGNATYDGSAHKPVVTVTVNGVALTEGTDFTVSYENNVNAGNAAKAVVTGKGIYSGTAEKEFTIEKADLSETDFTVSNTNPTYAYDSTHEVAVLLPVGLDAQYVKVGYSQGGTILTDLPKNAGTYDVSISVVGSPNYNDAFFQDKWQLVIEPKEAIVTVGTLGTEEYFFNGYPHTPKVFLDLGLLSAPSTEFEGCTVTYENNTQVGTAKVIVGGNYKGEATFVIQKGKPTIGLTSPLDKVMPGYVLTLTPTTNAIDNSYYTTTFTIEDGDGYSVDGFKITIDSGVAVNDVITIKVKSTETETYQAATGELKLTVGVPVVNTSELEKDIEELRKLIDQKAASAEVTEKLNEINAKISALENNGATDAELEEAKKDVTEAYTAALNKAVGELETKIAAQIDPDELAAEIKKVTDLIDALDDTYATDKAVEDAIAAAKKDVTDAYTAALNKAVGELETKIAAQIDPNELAAEIKKVTDLIDALDSIYATDKAVEEAIAAAKQEVTDAYTEALKKAVGELEKADKSNTDALNKAVEDLKALVKAAEAYADTQDAALKTALDKDIKKANELIAALDVRLTDAEKAIGEIEKAIEELKAVDAADAKALEDAITALNKAIEDAKVFATTSDTALNDQLTAKIDEADKALEGKVAEVQADLNKAVEELKKADASNASALAEAIDTLNKAIEAAKAAAVAGDKTLDGKITEAETALNTKIAEVQKNLDDAKTALDKAIAEGDAKLDDKIKALGIALDIAKLTLANADETNKAELETKLAYVEADLLEAIKKVSEDLANAKTELEQAIADGDTALDGKIAELGKALENAISAYEAADAALKAELIAKIEAADAALDGAIKAVQKNLDDAKAELNKAIADGDTALDGKIAALNDALVAAKSALEGADAANKSELTVKIDEAYASLDAAIKAVQKNLDDVKAELERADADNKAALESKDQELAAKDAELEAKTDELKKFIVIVCSMSGVALGGCGVMAVLFVIDRKKRLF